MELRNNLSTLRHTASHILAQAVKNIFPTVQLAIGPAIDNGFYYDFDFTTSVTKEDLPRIEQEMAKIIKADYPIEKFTLSYDDALKEMKGADYKIQLINELPKCAEITFYRQGNFIDLCAGPHVKSTGEIKHFKLTSLTGAYWKGNEANKMLTRIYGTAFPTKAELDEYLTALEEAKKRDHNKLGRDLDLFMTDEDIGQGLPLLKPKGAKTIQILQRFIEDEEEKRGYLLTRTPLMAKSNLYKTSGHWDHYRDKMFLIGDENSPDVLALRPMTCPFQFKIYKNKLVSYKELPVKYAETATLFRKEASGEMHGLIRVRQFTLSDGHIICTPEQIEEQFGECVELVYFLLDVLGIKDMITFRFSRWDPKRTEKYINEPKAWETTESLMKDILDRLKIDYTEAVDEAAFYGPKLDVQAKNVHGKEDTIITVQIDFALAKRFEMEYVSEDGTKKNPYIIHRSSIGCYERTLALLIEKYAGALPVWMSAEQVRVMSLTDRTVPQAEELVKKLLNKGIRAAKDIRNEKLGYKIREAQLHKIPYMVIIGDKEAEAGVIAVRGRQGDLGTMTENVFTEKILEEIACKK